LGATRFLRRLDGRTGLFLEQGFVTNTNEFPSAELQINCQRSAVLGLNEDENYVLEVEPNIIRLMLPMILAHCMLWKPYYNCKTAVRIFIFQRLLFRISHGLPGED
jgi:hypothetical protein